MSQRPSSSVPFCDCLTHHRGAAQAAELNLLLLLLVMAVLAMTLSTQAAAQSAGDTWSAQEVAGTVLVRTTGQAAAAWQPLAISIPIQAESEVATGSDGVALLANGADRIRLTPNSSITLPAPSSDLLTLIRQRFGRVLFDVAPRSDGRFEVEAPYLAVLVKGTHFIVDANYIENKVSVVEGDVETRRTRGNRNEGVDVGGGESADIAGPNGTLTISQTGVSEAGDAEESNGGPEEKPKVRVAPAGEPEPEPEEP